MPLQGCLGATFENGIDVVPGLDASFDVHCFPFPAFGPWVDYSRMVLT
jgi:hypothetical protein